MLDFSLPAVFTVPLLSRFLFPHCSPASPFPPPPLLRWNSLSGTIPDVTGLKSIKTLLLQSNQVRHNREKSWLPVSDVSLLDLPPSLGPLTPCFCLRLSSPLLTPYPQLNGTVPTTLGVLTTLNGYLYLCQNSLSGEPRPSETGTLPF